MKIKRREFLGRLATGSAILTMPAFIAGCGVNPAKEVTTATPGNPFYQWFGIDEAMIARVMAELTANGADTADLYFQHRRRQHIAMDDGVISSARSDIEQGVGLRIVVGGQTGYAFTEDLALPSMLEAARTAAAMANGSTGASMPPPQSFGEKKSGKLYRIEVPWSEIGMEQKLPLLEQVDREARRTEPSVKTVSVRWSDTDDRVLIATLDGHLIADHRPMTRLSAEIKVVRGDISQTGFAAVAARQGLSWYTDERIATLVKEAVDRSLILFDSRRPPSGEMPVVLAAGASGIVLHEAIGHTMEADFNRSGASVYAGMIGQKVAEAFVTIVDQGTVPGERGALNYDDEGNECGRTAMVEDGVLRSYLHDSTSARQYRVASTGSGRRQSYKFAPMPRMTCTFMEPGPHTKQEIVSAVDHGIIADIFTGGEVTLGGGDYTFHVKHGWLIEKGRITAPLKDVRISGNGPETLQRMTMVADDARFDAAGWTCGKNGQSIPVSQGMPTVLVSSMIVSGKNA
jgi:TldD protein